MKLPRSTLKAATRNVLGLTLLLGAARLPLEGPAEATAPRGNPLYAQGGGYAASWASHFLGFFVLALGVYVLVFIGSAMVARIRSFIRSTWRRQ